MTARAPRRGASAPQGSARARLLAACAVAAGLALGGCSTRRTLTIDSDPSGAHVWVNGKHLGTTPVEVPFIHPGTWNVRLEMKGYSSVAQDVGVKSTMADAPLLDLPGELTVRNRQWRYVHKLTPLPPRPTEPELEQALERAQGFRERARREATQDGATGSRR